MRRRSKGECVVTLQEPSTSTAGDRVIDRSESETDGSGGGGCCSPLRQTIRITSSTTSLSSVPSSPPLCISSSGGGRCPRPSFSSALCLFLLVYLLFLPDGCAAYGVTNSRSEEMISAETYSSVQRQERLQRRAAGTQTQFEGPEDVELSVLLSRLDDVKHQCGDVVEAERLLRTAVTSKFPGRIELARFFANHSKDFVPSLIEHSSFERRPPIENMNMHEKKAHFYVLQLNCSDNVRRWQPKLVFPSSDSTGRKGYLTLWMDPFEIDLCQSVNCSTKCSWTVHGGLRVLAKGCCEEDRDKTLCRTDPERGRNMLLAFNAGCALICLALIPVVSLNRRRQHEARGWALMEMFLIGASILYSILLLNWLAPPEAGCCIAVWLRQIGFSIFYGSIVLKIYRNLQEYRVRKAQHVSVREQDMMKYLAAMLALTITGLMAWTVGSWGDAALWRSAWPQCIMQSWSMIWQGYELLFLIYGMRLCYKARNSDWLERWQFTVAVCLEAIITLMANLIRYSIRNSGHSDTLFTVAFVQIQLTVSVNMVIIIAPKFYLSSGESNRRSMTIGGHSGRAHPSLAKLRDNILNGTIDFAEVPIVDMNPEDIRAELKRVYTQLRMYKLKNLYQDNPHISKKRGGKKWSDKTTSKAEKRRISIPGCSPQATKSRIEEDEKSDLTVESSPHNIYLSNYKLQLEPNHSVRV